MDIESLKKKIGQIENLAAEQIQSKDLKRSIVHLEKVILNLLEKLNTEVLEY